MRALIQRVKEAQVIVDGQVVSQIGPGLLTFLGVGKKDTIHEVEWLVKKINHLRIFEDEAGKMNLGLKEIQGEHLVVSQFTLYGDCSSGNRPGFAEAATPEVARPLIDQFIFLTKQLGISTHSGIFGADMKVKLLNDGPVTFWIDTESKNA